MSATGNHQLVPLRWSAGYADKLATIWSRHLFTLAYHHSNTSRLNLRFRTSAENPRLSPAGDMMVFDLKGPIQETIPFGAVVWCVGFGSEQTAVGDFKSYDFWDTDPFDTQDLERRTA
jgi:hypothetical protein